MRDSSWRRPFIGEQDAQYLRYFPLFPLSVKFRVCPFILQTRVTRGVTREDGG